MSPSQKPSHAPSTVGRPQAAVSRVAFTRLVPPETGVVMACAIALHNIPEGMTIGASFAVSSDLMWGTGMIMAVLIGLHNIPEGMAVAVPLISGGTSARSVVEGAQVLTFDKKLNRLLENLS